MNGVAFSEKTRRAFPGPDYDSLEAEFERGRSSAVGCIPCRLVTPVATLPMKVHNALHAALLRNLELTASFVGSYEVRLDIPLFVLSRAILETGCLAWDAWQKLAEVMNEGETSALDGYDEYIQHVVLGVRTSFGRRDPEEFRAHNILSVMDRIDRANPVEIRALYETLSELAHPNSPGLVDTYAVPAGSFEVVEYEPHPFESHAAALTLPVDAATIGLNLSVEAVNRLEKSFHELVAFAENALHDAGEWPGRWPFPRTDFVARLVRDALDGDE